MNRLRAAGFGGSDNLVDFQVAVSGLAAAKVYADIGFAAMPGITVGAAVYSHRVEAQCFGCAHHAAGNLAAVGDQYRGDKWDAH